MNTVNKRTVGHRLISTTVIRSDGTQSVTVHPNPNPSTSSTNARSNSIDLNGGNRPQQPSVNIGNVR